MGHRHVLFVNHVAVMGGAEYCLLDMAAAYRKSCQVLLFADGPLRERLKAIGIRTTILQASDSILGVRTSSGLSSLQTIPKLWQLAGAVADVSRNFEVIHTNSQKAFVVAALATLRGAPPVIWHLRDIMTAKHFSGLNRRVAVTLANRLVSRVVVVSQAAADEFVAVGGRRDLVDVVYDGISAAPFGEVTPRQTAAVREELGIGDDIRLVGVFSRLSFWKGQHILVEAMRHLPDHVHGLIVGDALFGEDEYVSQFKALIADPEIAQRVHWLGFRPDVPVLMSACDIVVHTSTEPEPCARMAIEGQLMQKPVIASAAGGMYEIIEDGQTGCLYPPGNVSLLAQKIHDLLSDPLAAKLLAEAGQAHALKRFSLENHLNTLDRVIEDVVQQVSRRI